MLFPLMSGVTCVIDHGLESVDFLNFLTESKITRLVNATPFFLKLLLNCKNEKRSLPGIKTITVGISWLSPSLRKAFQLLKVRVLQCYGQIENLWTIAIQKLTDDDDSLTKEYPRGYIGHGIPGLKYKVLDNDGEEIQSKGPRTGLLAVTGPTIMQGYFGVEKENKMVIRGTWLYTGDIVELDGEGENLVLTFIGRKDDVLLMQGKPVPFFQIEAALKTNFTIHDAAAFPVKSSNGTTRIVCVVVKKEKSGLNEKKVLDHCTSTLPKYFVPFAAAFIDVIPRDMGNNINYSKLRSQFSGLGG
jgi:acyl-CoA synthetase (AMP-forming)/AMP-acid ligase II